MGPRSNDRGNALGYGLELPYRDTLQWGRDQMIAEILGLINTEGVAHPLQWGRDQMIAEIGSAGGTVAALTGFNGAAIK